MYTPPSASSSSSGIQDITNSWMNALTKPSVQTFQQEAARATQPRIQMNLIIAAVGVAVLGLIGGLISGHPFGGLIGAVLSAALSFAVSVGALYVGARSQGGTGTLEQQMWTQSTYWVPILLINAILAWVPAIGGIVAFVLFVYSLYLTYLNLQAVHRLDGSKAIVGMLIAAVIMIVAYIVIGLLLAPLYLLGG